MSDETTLKRLEVVIARFFDDPTLTLSPAMTAADVPGWDSLANVELMVEVEEAFGIRFRTGEVASLSSVGDLAAAIERRMTGAPR